MKNELPLVSIVTPVCNGSKYLEDLIRSVLEQDYPYIEHIIIDDGSSDDGATVEILRRFPHLRWWSRGNIGAYATMNEGLLAATGQVVTFINSDDLYGDRHAIRDVVSWWQRHPRYDAVAAGHGRIDANGHSILRRVYTLRYPRWLVFYYEITSHCSLFLDRRKLVEEAVMFDTSLSHAADRDWAIQMYRKRFRIGFISRVVSKLRHHDGQRSYDDNGAPMLNDLARIQQRYGLSPVTKRLVEYIERLMLLYGACVEDLRAGDMGMAWRRVTRGTWKAKLRDSM